MAARRVWWGRWDDGASTPPAANLPCIVTIVAHMLPQLPGLCFCAGMAPAGPASSSSWAVVSGSVLLWTSKQQPPQAQHLIAPCAVLQHVECPEGG